jgi:hypothetical protein
MNKMGEPVKQEIRDPTLIATMGDSRDFTIDELHDAHERVKNNSI